MTFRAAILKTILDYKLWDFQSRLILAVSGGRDSMAMFHAIRFLTPDPAHQLVTVHIDHAVRPESAEDAEFVEQASIDAGIPFVGIRLKNSRPPKGVSAEQHWRVERYKILHDMCAKTGAVAIATAHTATDHVETILMRMVTGAGPRGFLGIRLVRKDGVIRPLLHVTREEVTAFADKQKICWREDSSNRDISRPRNAIRKNILPTLKQINQEAERNVVHSSMLLADEDLFLSDYALKILARSNWNNALPALLDLSAFEDGPNVIIRRCAAALYSSFGPQHNFRVTETHLQALAECLTGNRSFCPLPGGGKAIVKNRTLLMLPGVCHTDRFREIRLLEEGTFRIGAYSVTISHHSDGNFETEKMNLTNASIRTRRSNDRFKHPNTRTERLSEIFRSRRIPLEIRPLLPLIVDQHDEVVWSADPFRISEIGVCLHKNRWIKLTCKPISAIRC